MTEILVEDFTRVWGGYDALIFGVVNLLPPDEAERAVVEIRRLRDQASDLREKLQGGP